MLLDKIKKFHKHVIIQSHYYKGGLRMHKYRTQGVCASEIDFEIENGLVKNVLFIDGCPGNLEAICKLVEGMPVTEVIKKLRGIVCQNDTSCADQFVSALEDVIKK